MALCRLACAGAFEFTSGSLPYGLFWLAFEFREDAPAPLWAAAQGRAGDWVVARPARPCRPKTVRDGLVAVSWKPVSDRPLSKDTRRLSVALSGYGCHGRTPLSSLLREVEFRQVEERLAVHGSCVEAA